MKVGIVDTGGGLRGVYAAGVLDFCLEQGIYFDVGIGVSAGSGNISSYMAGQKKRTYQFYVDYSSRKQYMSLRNFVEKKTYIDLDYVYGTLSNSDGENPLDYDRFIKSPQIFLAVATDAETGEVKYFSKEDMPRDDYSILKASCAIPYICHPYGVRGRLYYDGALSDPIPVEKAFSLGCDKVVLILTRPENVPRTPEKDEKLASKIQKTYPVAAEKFRRRAENYNRGVARARQYAKEGKVLIIAPDNTCGMDTLTKDPKAMKLFYEKGVRDAWKDGVNFFL